MWIGEVATSPFNTYTLFFPLPTFCVFPSFFPSACFIGYSIKDSRVRLFLLLLSLFFLFFRRVSFLRAVSAIVFFFLIYIFLLLFERRCRRRLCALVRTLKWASCFLVLSLFRFLLFTSSLSQLRALTSLSSVSCYYYYYFRSSLHSFIFLFSFVLCSAFFALENGQVFVRVRLFLFVCLCASFVFLFVLSITRICVL